MEKAQKIGCIDEFFSFMDDRGANVFQFLSNMYDFGRHDDLLGLLGEEPPQNIVSSAFPWSKTVELSGYWLEIDVAWRQSKQNKACMDMLFYGGNCVVFQANGKLYGQTKRVMFMPDIEMQERVN